MSEELSEMAPCRRRPRPRSVASVDVAQATQNCSKQASMLNDALSLSYKAEIDTILEKRQKDGPPLPDDDDRARANGSFEVAVSRQTPMTEDEVAEAHEDIFGRPPPDVARCEERILALEREVGHLPKSERRALTWTLRKHPLLFANCPHTKMFLELEEEDFDAASAARRLAKYWESRRAVFGDKMCYAPGTFTEPVLVDYRRFYARTLAIVNDPDTDEMARDDAKKIVQIIHDKKLAAIDACLQQIENNAREREDEATEDMVLKATARAMAKDTLYDMKVQFLQVENMIEAKAAQRMVKYWETGLRLFGPSFEHLKSVTLEDMEDCAELFRLGLMRLMPSEDDCGRSILIYRNVASMEGNEDSSLHMTEERLLELGINEHHFAKVVWYMFHAALERNLCRQHGLVVFIDMKGVTLKHFMNFKAHRQATSSVGDCMPVKIRAFHCLLDHNHSWWRSLLGGLFSVVNAASKRRFVVHACDMEENIEELDKTFGIKPDNLPVDIGGTVDAEYFVRWLEERKAKGL